MQAAAQALGVRLLLVNASSLSEIETAFADVVQQRADALQVSSDGFLLARVHHVARQCGGVAARGARAADGDAGGSSHQRQGNEFISSLR